MPRERIRVFVLFVSLSAACSAQSTTTETAAPKPDPIAYLNRALDEMEAHALRRGAVDWPRVRAEALARVAHAETTVDTYDAIRFALTSLGDHHSSLHPTPALAGLEQRRNAQHSSIQEVEVQRSPRSPFVGRYEPEGRLERFKGKQFALVVVTKCFPENDVQFVAYETKLQKIIANLDKSHPVGWVVDLRGNVGGNMWPMLAGVGPVLGEGDDLGEFFTTEGHAVWRYRDGIASEIEDGKENPYPRVEGVPYKLPTARDVAVLIDGGTGSSGEATAIAFRGRPRTRFFGQHTEGVSTVNETFALSDGASMWLTIGVQADRSGKQYLEGLGPDELVVVGDNIPSDAQDAVLQEALKWLSRTPQK
jgi:carboxyl-terminal processing protease